MLENYWHIACLLKDIRKKPKAITLFSKHIVVFLDDTGTPCAIEDRCAHRNMPLHCGKVIHGELQCPYHGWRYNSQGEVTHIPTAIKDSIKHKAKIPTYPCLEQDGYIWVCMSGQPTEKKPPLFKSLKQAGWTSFRMQTQFNSTVENCLENFLDVPHAAFIHKFWFRASDKKIVRAVVNELDDGAFAEYFSESRKNSLVFGFLSNRKTSLKHTDRFIAPSMSKVDYRFSDNRHYIISSFCSPQTDTITNVFTVITFKYGIFSPLIRCIFEPISRIIIKQDVKALAKQQANIDKFGEEKFTWIPQDILRPSIIRWRNSIKQGKTYKPSTEAKEIDLHI